MGHFVVDNIVDHAVDVLLVVDFEAFACCFDRIDEHDDGCLAAEWGRAKVAIVGNIYFFVGVLQFGLGVEISCHCGSVVSANEIGHFGRKLVFFCQRYAVAYVLCDDMGAFLRVEIVVRVESVVLVLSEIERRHYFSYVVIECSDFGQQRVASDFVNNILRNVGHLDAVLEGSRSLLREFAQSRGVGA